MSMQSRSPLRFVVLATVALATGALATACQAESAGLRSFGSMREVMRNGHDEGRVDLTQFDSATTIAVGAMAGLGGEITIVDGETLVATVRDGTATTRIARAGDQATLLVAQEVAAWHDYEIGSCASYDELERAIARLIRSRGDDPNTPTPVRIHGKVPRLQVHVIAGACPIANPAGPSPWRYDGPADNVKLVGFYVEGAAGKWTHHNHQSHLHAVSDQAMGHLDDIAIEDAVVSLPVRR